MDKITVVCHKDHDKGYEDFQGKCLLCVVESLEKRIQDLVNFRRATGEISEWVGLKGDEISECWKTGDVVAAVEAKLKEKNHR